MSQALHTSSTGINAGQQQINVIANNVANINTTAFKSANVTFETLYSHNLSYGSAATKEGGGTNPKQIGLGTKIGGISRNFTPGTFVSTGRELDLMISGNGFFVVKNSDGKQYFTRDGVLSLDSAGNLVTSSGMKVVGAESIYSTTSSATTVKVPTNLRAEVKGDDKLGTKTLSQLNNANITTGEIKATVTYKDGDGNDQTKTVTLSVGSPTDKDPSINNVVQGFNTALADTGVSFEVNSDGTISYSVADTSNIHFDSATTNFLAQTGLNSSNKSFVLNEIVAFTEPTSYTDSKNITLDGVTVDENGILAASYSDGSVLTKYLDDTQSLSWKYTTPDGTVITGKDIDTSASSLANSNFIIELANMVNQEGLVSINNNLWQWGADVGEIFYGMAGEKAFGKLESGGYETSNVDISTELTNMISAQRMIQMNSRVFSTASTIMETLAYLGQ